MVFGNTFFKKDDEKLITYKSGNCATVIDYAVVQKEVMKKVKDIKVILGEECFSQHRLLIMDVLMEHRAVRKLKNPGKVTLWRLKDDKIKKMMKDEMKDAKDKPESWDDWCKYIMNVAKRVCGISKGGHNQKTTWWCSEEVKEVIKEKRRLYKVLQKKKDQRSKEQYWAMKKKVKRVVAAAKEKEGKKITELLEKKNSKALQYVFKLCKQSKKDKKDIMGMPCILEKNGKLKMTLQEKIKIWKEYEEKLLNEENDWNKSMEQVSTEDVMEALILMNTGKAAGPSRVTVELLNVCKQESVRRLAEVANNMLEGNKMPESWRKSDLISIFKGKGDVRSCGNYRSIKLLEHGMRVIERIFERRLRKIVKLDEMQVGFMPGRGTTDAIFIMRQLLEKYEMAGRDLYNYGICGS